jgi:putative ABC transport system substrate-binding protein
MRRRELVIGSLALGTVHVLRGSAAAQTGARIPRIGLLRSQARDTPDAAADGFLRGLHDLGYTEGQNVHLEYRWAGGRPERLSALAAQLAGLHVDVIVTGGEQAIQAAKDAAPAIPVVMGASNDPVAAGLVSSLARPGGNVTGMTILSGELSRKRLDLMKEVLPRTTRVAVLTNPTFPGSALDLRHTLEAARTLGMTLETVEVRTPADLDAAVADSRRRAEALLPLADPFFTAHRVQIVSLARRHRLPAMYYWAEFVEAGGLISYGPNLFDLYRQAASHVDKILRGTRPAALPVEQPTTFQLAVNIRTARALELTLAPSIRGRADRVIE